MSDAIPRRLPEGNEFEITIDKIVYGGSGLGRFQGKVVFVPFTAVGGPRSCSRGSREEDLSRGAGHSGH